MSVVNLQKDPLDTLFYDMCHVFSTLITFLGVDLDFIPTFDISFYDGAEKDNLSGNIVVTAIKEKVGKPKAARKVKNSNGLQDKKDAVVVEIVSPNEKGIFFNMHRGSSESFQEESFDKRVLDSGVPLYRQVKKRKEIKGRVSDSESESGDELDGLYFNSSKKVGFGNGNDYSPSPRRYKNLETATPTKNHKKMDEMHNLVVDVNGLGQQPGTQTGVNQAGNKRKYRKSISESEIIDKSVNNTPIQRQKSVIEVIINTNEKERKQGTNIMIGRKYKPKIELNTMYKEFLKAKKMLGEYGSLGYPEELPYLPEGELEIDSSVDIANEANPWKLKYKKLYALRNSNSEEQYGILFKHTEKHLTSADDLVTKQKSEIGLLKEHISNISKELDTSKLLCSQNEEIKSEIELLKSENYELKARNTQVQKELLAEQSKVSHLKKQRRLSNNSLDVVIREKLAFSHQLSGLTIIDVDNDDIASYFYCSISGRNGTFTFCLTKYDDDQGNFEYSPNPQQDFNVARLLPEMFKDTFIFEANDANVFYLKIYHALNR
ncbi:hypothetical protein AX774_g2843 [Zancudomyces culisetae]|uniref:Monopolin complex subunit Csm1/Pcs1 C-terminal domain-containing protein n=1 Tax=Zancudomyces culisetae TaxID=1213189 RepID=A0A1R1PRV1_ZANCU|nr:hypothetical protein AX774_g2843 [Zancudomyces culisetae]|eukprot:OMH83659.1 hypothetical protein AX774_g2843 [Zancudomyces culisetae]